MFFKCLKSEKKIIARNPLKSQPHMTQLMFSTEENLVLAGKKLIYHLKWSKNIWKIKRTM